MGSGFRITGKFLESREWGFRDRHGLKKKTVGLGFQCWDEGFGWDLACAIWGLGGRNPDLECFESINCMFRV